MADNQDEGGEPEIVKRSSQALGKVLQIINDYERKYRRLSRFRLFDRPYANGNGYLSKSKVEPTDPPDIEMTAKHRDMIEKLEIRVTDAEVAIDRCDDPLLKPKLIAQYTELIKHLNIHMMAVSNLLEIMRREQTADKNLAAKFVAEQARIQANLLINNERNRVTREVNQIDTETHTNDDKLAALAKKYNIPEEQVRAELLKIVNARKDLFVIEDLDATQEEDAAGAGT